MTAVENCSSDCKQLYQEAGGQIRILATGYFVTVFPYRVLSG